MRTERNLLDRLARFIVGAEPDILDRCTPQEQRHVLNKAILVAFPAIVALFSGYCAVDAVFVSSSFGTKTLFALTWSLVVLAFDRAIMIQTTVGVWSWAFLIRAIMAGALSLLLTEPILQKVFADSIQQAEHIKAEKAKAEVDARFLPEIQALKAEMSACEAETQRLRQIYQVEINGEGGTRIHGTGPVSAIQKYIYEQQKQICATLAIRNQDQLDALDRGKLEAKLKEVKALATSLAGRLTTLHELTMQNWFIAWAVWLFRIVLFSAEIMPLVLKFGKRKHRNEDGEYVNDEQYSEIEIMRNEEHLHLIRQLTDTRQQNDLLGKQLEQAKERTNLEMRHLRQLADSRRLQIRFIIERQQAMENLKTEAIDKFEMLQPDEQQHARHKHFVERMAENYQRTLASRYLRFSFTGAAE